MKKNIIIASLLAGAFLTTMSCGNKKVDGPNPDADSTEVNEGDKAKASNVDPWPWDFPRDVKVDVEKAQAWIKNGAQPTDTVKALLKKANVL